MRMLDWATVGKSISPWNTLTSMPGYTVPISLNAKAVVTGQRRSNPLSSKKMKAFFGFAYRNLPNEKAAL